LIGTISGTTLTTFATALVFFVGAVPFCAAETSLRLSTGLEYSSGKYGGTEDIEELYVPLTFTLNTNRVGMSLSVPYLSVRAPTGTVTDGQAVPGEGEITTESGLGDITANLTIYDVYYSANMDLALDVTAAAKIGTADFEKGLGTGENDYSLYLDAYKWFEEFALFGSLGYRWRGDPAGVDLNNVLVTSVGGSWPSGDSSTLGIIFDYRESSLEGYDDVQELTAFGSFEMGEHWYMQLFAYTGFTDSSTDWGGGFTITTDMRRPPSRDNF
jgi:hypothetical protein